MKDQSPVRSVTTRLTTALFIIYLIILFWILLFKLGVQFSYMGKRSVNLSPFSGPSIVNGENILNVIIFIPLGIYAAVLFKSWAFTGKLFFIFLSSLLVEGSQFIFRVGAFDVTDIITNTIGGIIGLIVFKLVETAFNNSIKAEKFINVISAIATVLTILLLVLLKMNMLPVRYQ